MDGKNKKFIENPSGGVENQSLGVGCADVNGIQVAHDRVIY
jgi:hypothetical protein